MPFLKKPFLYTDLILSFEFGLKILQSLGHYIPQYNTQYNIMGNKLPVM
jgi:hypothetical protein